MLRSLPARAAACLTAVGFLSLVTAGTASAQVSTATIQGTVSDSTGVLPGATVTARDVQSGFTDEATTAGDGTFALAGLRPGRYQITVAVSQYKPEAKTVEVLVGQTVNLNFRITPDVMYTEAVTVVGNTRLVDTRKSEVTTNITQEQLRHLPQNSRNFLNFAAIAPGVRVSDNEFRKEFSAGALPSQNINVFIDGVSYKNDVIDGGVAGQDSSRGNPFPQNAVQEFQVLTQNFKAEYEKAASAIITAITKSGGNRYSGEIFNFYQDKNLVESEIMIRNAAGLFEKGETTPKPTFDRWQWGVSLGGPIVKDRLQFFGSYEENRQDRDAAVTTGTVSTAPASLVARLRAYEGVFTSPFREKLLFAKSTLQPTQGQRAEVTYSWRNETDIRGFGGQGASNSFETAENVKNRVDSLQGKWQASRTRLFNEAYLSYQRYRWNPKPENPDIIGENFEGLLRIGGRDTEQFIVQQRTSIRDDFSQFLTWGGHHTAKGGGIVSFVNYDVRKLFNANPLFVYRGDISWDFPARAHFGAGDPDLSAGNLQLGFFAQDDWAVNSRLTLNLGLRWDYESDMLNNDYVTPENARAAAAPFVDNARYFTDGDDRPPFYGAWQGRLGFSYDISGKGQTTAFGGWGRYYDRVLYNSTLDERFRLQYAVRTFQFSQNGGIRDGLETIVWDPSYLSVAGLESIVARGLAPNPEVFLIANDAEPPVSDQWSLGVRHSFAGILTSVTYTGIRSRNLFTFIFGTRRPDGSCCQTVPGFSNILISDPDGRKALVRRPLRPDRSALRGGGHEVRLRCHVHVGQSGADGWRSVQPRPPEGRRLSPVSDRQRRAPPARADRHRGAALRLHREHLHHARVRYPYTIDDQSRGGGVNERVLQRNAGRPERFTFIIPDAWAYRTVDLQLEKAFRLGGLHQISAIFQGFNIFSYDNFSGYQGFIPTLPAVNPNFGRPSSLLDQGRRLQFGVRYGF